MKRAQKKATDPWVRAFQIVAIVNSNFPGCNPVYEFREQPGGQKEQNKHREEQQEIK